MLISVTCFPAMSPFQVSVSANELLSSLTVCRWLNARGVCNVPDMLLNDTSSRMRLRQLLTSRAPFSWLLSKKMSESGDRPSVEQRSDGTLPAMDSREVGGERGGVGVPTPGAGRGQC